MRRIITDVLKYPIRTTADVAAINLRLWRTGFWQAWGPLPLDAKFCYIAFVSQTIALITILELFLLKK